MKILLDITPAQETTCGDGSGKFCPYFATKKFGQITWCCIFNKETEQKNGWTQRLDECYKMTAKN